jgi:hypothetical protein
MVMGEMSQNEQEEAKGSQGKQRRKCGSFKELFSKRRVNGDMVALDQL